MKKNGSLTFGKKLIKYNITIYQNIFKIKFGHELPEARFIYHLINLVILVFQETCFILLFIQFF